MSLFKRYTIMCILILGAQLVTAKDIPQGGYVTNYSLMQNFWRLCNYLSGNYNRKKEIIAAIKRNDKETFKRKFMKGDLVDHPDIVIEIITHNKLELLQLLDEDFDLDITAIVEHYHEQSKKPRYEFMHKLFQEHGADAIAMKEFLKDRGFTIDIKNDTGRGVGHVALERRDLHLLYELVHKKDIDINAPDTQEETLLHAAARSNDTELFMAVMQAEPDLNKRNSRGETPFFIAATRDDSEKLELLSRAHANVNIGNNEGMTPGHIAATGQCSIKSAKIIFESDLDPKIQNNDGLSTRKILKIAKFRECIKNLEKISDKESFARYKKRCNHFLALESLLITSRIHFLNKKTKKLKEERNVLIEQELLADKQRLAQHEQWLTDELARIEVEKQKLENQKKEKQEELKDLDDLEQVLSQPLDEYQETIIQHALSEETIKKQPKD